MSSEVNAQRRPDAQRDFIPSVTRFSTDFLAAGVAVADPHPHPVPTADVILASSAQQALVPDGAGPPQQVCGAPPCVRDVSAVPRFGVCD